MFRIFRDLGSIRQGRRGTAATRRPPFRPRVEALEDRTVPATFFVTTTADSGPDTLRQAILDANASTRTFDTIKFNIPGAGVQTISPLVALPDITDPVFIDGTTQPGFAGKPIIELDGGNLSTDIVSGLSLAPGSDFSIIRGLVINRFGYLVVPAWGIRVSSSFNQILGNYLGTDATGTVALGNGTGILVAGGSGNTIGGPAPGDRNVISGNGDAGIDLRGTNNTAEGNYIGTDPSGSFALPNGFGVVIFESGTKNNVLRNLISGNTLAGIFIGGGGTGQGSAEVIQGNHIGTDASGKLALPNGGPGVVIGDNAHDNLIGGSAPGAGNLIAYNAGPGVSLQAFLGSGVEIRANAIQGNSIFANGGLGIDLGGDGVTPNTPGGPHTGLNDLQNFPVLASAVTDAGGLTIQGTLNSTPGKTFRVEFFANPTADPSGHGQGQSFLGFTSVTTGSDGNANFTATFAAVPVGQFLSATATDPDGNTSEFAQDIAVTAPPPPAPPPPSPSTTGPSGTRLVVLYGGRRKTLPVGLARRSRLFRQRVVLTNPSGAALTGPYRLVLNGLAGGLSLVHVQGRGVQAQWLGGRAVLLDFGPAGLAPGAEVSLVLTFRKPAGGARLLGVFPLVR